MNTKTDVRTKEVGRGVKKRCPMPPVDDAVRQEKQLQHREFMKGVPAHKLFRLAADYPIPSPNPSQGATDDIFFQSKKQLIELGARAAAGDGRAAARLLNMAQRAVRDLTSVATKCPELLSPFAAIMNDWPVSWPRNKSRQNQIFVLLDRIGLGKNAAFKWKGKAFDVQVPSNKIALSLLRGIEQTRKNIQDRMVQASFIFQESLTADDLNDFDDLEEDATLKMMKQKVKKISAINDPLLQEIEALPRFCSDSVCLERWFNAAWKLLLRHTDGHPEKNLEYRKLGKHRVSKERIIRWKEKNPGKHFSPKSEIRTGIRDELKKSFKRMAR